jgi:pimeloyl-ACP methyl ester carboxylesterase
LTTFVRARDGRRIAVLVSGNPAGHPVFLMHGTPGSRLGPVPPGSVLRRLGVRLISFDRPGYGRSDRLKSRLVADVATDVRAIAEHLGLNQFAVLGRSGGGPHALACAAMLPDRVTRAAALASLAPQAAAGLDWFAGMADSNVHEFTTAANGPTALAAFLTEMAAKLRATPPSHVSALDPEMPEADRRVASDSRVRIQLTESFAEALRESADGWIDDDLAFCAPWGFDLADIKVPVLLWHGEDDAFSPAAHSSWLADQIPDAVSTLCPATAHFGALDAVPEALSWLISA